MTYFGPAQLGIEWDWAEEYTIGDRYFPSCLCETDLNKIFSIAANNLGETQDFEPPPHVPANRSIFSELGHYGAYYLEDPL
jgi:phospholipase C